LSIFNIIFFFHASIYELVGSTYMFIMIDQTSVEDIASALVFLQGKLVAGIGRILRVYDLGKKKLLRKCESKVCLFS
jgi:splicing factor 3B subunit 3